MKNMMSKSLALTKSIVKESWELLVDIMSHLGRFIAMMLVFSIIFYGLKPFVTLLFFFAIGSVPDTMGPVLLDTMGPVLVLLALPISISYLVIPFWGAWMINKLMSKERKTRTRAKVILWLILSISVVGSLFNMILSASS